MIDFDAYDIYRDVSTLDHHLWLQDIPLCQSCNKYNGGTRIFPMNLSISDWSAYYKVAKPKDFTFKFYLPLIQSSGERYPQFKETIDSLFLSDNPYLKEEENVLKINYARTYDFMNYILTLKEIGYEDLNNFLIAHKAEIDKDFYTNLLKVIKSNEFFARTAIMVNTLYYIFDKDEFNVDRYINLFNRNNKWVFNTKVDKFNELFSALKAIIDNYQQTKVFDKNELLTNYKKLVEYRRTVFKKYNDLDYNFYLDFVD